jgi:hypothetical protein
VFDAAASACSSFSKVFESLHRNLKPAIKSKTNQKKHQKSKNQQLIAARDGLA